MEILKAYITRIRTLSHRTADLLSISEYDTLPSEVESLLVNLNSLNKEIENVDFEEVNSTIASVYLLTVINYYNIFLDALSKHQSVSYTTEKEEELIIFSSRLQVLLEIFSRAVYYNKQDLFSFSRSDERWQRLKPYVKFHQFPKPDKLQKKYQKLMTSLTIGQASAAKGHQSASKLTKKLSFGVYALYYSAFTTRAVKKAEVFRARPEFEVINSLYGLLETKFVKNVMKLVIPPIKVNRKFFVPRTVSHVFEHFQLVDVSPNIQRSSGANVRVRFLNYKKEFSEGLIFHIHGGGFVAMSSGSHQCYTRKWVKSLRMPCLSIDYRLAPRYPFPAALDDVWQVYNWVIRHSEAQLNVKANKIFIVGDSAGGNLAMSLTYRICEMRMKAPAGVLLAYPALNLSMEQFTPSMLISLDDKLLPQSFLRVCVQSYVPSDCSQENYFVSPINAPPGILKELPPVRMATGDKDPMHDDTWRFMEKLVNCGVDVQLCIFEGMVHGALNLCYNGGLKESRDMVNQFEEWITELANL